MVLGNKNDLPNALDHDGMRDRLNLESIHDRDVACYSISCKNKTNIDVVLQVSIFFRGSASSRTIIFFSVASTASEEKLKLCNRNPKIIHYVPKGSIPHLGAPQFTHICASLASVS